MFTNQFPLSPRSRALMDGWMDILTDRQTDGWTDGTMDQPTKCHVGRLACEKEKNEYWKWERFGAQIMSMDLIQCIE